MIRIIVVCALIVVGGTHSTFAMSNGKVSGVSPTLTVAIDNNSLTGHLSALEEQPIACSELVEKFTEPRDRGAAELLIICHALLLNGADSKVVLRGVPNHVRSLYLVESGLVDLAAESVWLDRIDLSKVHASEAILDHGEFEKRLYTVAGHEMHTLNPDELDIRAYLGLILRTWEHDWYTLTQLSHDVSTALDLDAMFRMISKGRADFTLLESHRHGRDYFKRDGVTLLPVDGVYVVLDGTRHLVMSRASPHGRWLQGMLNPGIKQLKASGRTTEIYAQSGFLSSSKQGLKKLEPQY